MPEHRGTRPPGEELLHAEGKRDIRLAREDQVNLGKPLEQRLPHDALAVRASQTDGDPGMMLLDPGSQRQRRHRLLKGRRESDQGVPRPVDPHEAAVEELFELLADILEDLFVLGRELGIGRQENFLVVVQIAGEARAEEGLRKQPLAPQHEAEGVVDPFVCLPADELGQVEVEIGQVAVDPLAPECSLEQADPQGRPPETGKGHVDQEDSRHCRSPFGPIRRSQPLGFANKGDHGQKHRSLILSVNVDDENQKSRATRAANPTTGRPVSSAQLMQQDGPPPWS